MTEQVQVAKYSCAEEVANSITHGIGALLSIGGLAVLVGFASLRGDAWHIVSCSIFGSALVFSYLASALYHSIPLEKTKKILRTIDHSAIYLLIAGTYTPFMLVNLRGPWGWSLFGAVWGIALIGIILKTAVFSKIHGLSTALYLLMGWIIVIAIKPMLSVLERGGLELLLLGGLAYTVGVVFYAWKKLPYNHAIWHLFVLAGSCFHFFAILFYVIPS
ncbi:MAG: hemolysin III family protein [Deltaproteobacteria bacterium]|nr:hemolysin III family protein [Deltaproteobacteria bacterium]MCW8893953.1 hemolysin III family protein [Deltaproteobacteria bacterium]MCW9050381.1 hemolysin III family protein [Deltaproteobacteria bacterium]